MLAVLAHKSDVLTARQVPIEHASDSICGSILKSVQDDHPTCVTTLIQNHMFVGGAAACGYRVPRHAPPCMPR